MPINNYTNILIAVSGSTPQILTETLYNLVVQRKIPIDEIYVLTTTHGQAKMHETVLKNNLINKMYWDYQLQHLKLPSLQIVLLKDSQDNNLDDVRTIEDNEAAAAQIIDFVKEKTFVSNSRLFCSLAGGRKTMSSYMAIALNLFGRAQDELSHVLIYPEEREKDRNFFFPAPDDHETRIEYAQIPFIRLREKLEKIFGDIAQLGYDELLKLTKLDLEDLARDVTVTLFKNSRKIDVKWGDNLYTVEFEPKLFTIYRFLFEKNKPYVLADNLSLKKLYSEVYGHGKEGKFDCESIKKDVSAINHRVLEPALPEFLYALLRVQPVKNAVYDCTYLIHLHSASRNIEP